MQTIKGFLDTIKEFLENKMEENHITLPQAPQEGMQGEELVYIQPLVIMGNLPHANFTTYGMEGRYLSAPYIAIGTDEYSYDYEDETLQILIQVCCYSVEQYEDTKDESMKDLKIPDNMGTLDALNLLENMKDWIIKDATFPVNKPIRLGSYDTKELTYPFSFGYINFEMTTNEGKGHKIDFNNL